MDEIILQSELEAKRIKQGLCPRCGYVVNKLASSVITETGKIARRWTHVRCTKCSFSIVNGLWDQSEGYCIKRSQTDAP